jgi:hypothetical protein
MFGEDGDTLQDDQQLDVAGGQDDGSQLDDDGGQQQDEYFLDVDERNRYKTKEDVIKAIQSSGKRISDLAVYEKVAKEFGGVTPPQMKQLLLELVDRREKEKQAAAKAKDDKPSTDTQSDEDLTPEEKKALKWLQKQAPKLGFVPKDELAKLQKQMEEMGKNYEGLNTQRQEERLNSLVSKGRNQLKTMLASAKLPTDNKDFMDDLEDFIAAYVNKSEERVEKFYGSEEANQEIIKEAFERALKSFNLVKTKTATGYVNQKNNTISKTGRKLPVGGQRDADTRLTNQKKRGITPSVHDKAWAAMQEAMGNNGE